MNRSLEETSLQVVHNLPRFDECLLEERQPSNLEVSHLSPSPPLRVMRDVEAVRQEATLLKEQMHTVKEDIKKVSLVQ